MRVLAQGLPDHLAQFPSAFAMDHTHPGQPRQIG